ncbi:MAG: hypothetical protein U9N49_09425 [Campylobacterota bacterium]|nr:hypothetical protein [Campylobacterota bacterium]
MNEKYDLENYERFLGKIKDEKVHWLKLEKRTATLFQVLIDKDLKELVFVLKHHPEYIEVVCDHFRYLYNYSETVADIYAASKLLKMSEGYHQKQFVRNLVRKLEKIEDFDLGEIKAFLETLISKQDEIHPIIISFYKSEIEHFLESQNYHKLQTIAINKKLDLLKAQNDFDFQASDRDASLDIPYME